MGLCHSLLKQTYLTVILLEFGRKSCWILSQQVTCSTPLQHPQTDQRHTQPPCRKWAQDTLWLLERLASLHPNAWSRWQLGRRRDPKEPHGTNMFWEPGTCWSFLLQKLYIIWAQEQGHEDNEAICSRGLLPWRFEFFPLYLPFSWTWCKSLPGGLPQCSFYASGLTLKASRLQLGDVIRTSKMLYRVQSYLKTAGYKELHMSALKLWALMRSASLLLSCKNNEQ